MHNIQAAVQRILLSVPILVQANPWLFKYLDQRAHLLNPGPGLVACRDAIRNGTTLQARMFISELQRADRQASDMVTCCRAFQVLYRVSADDVR
jgi:hypothetical protein